MAGRKAQQRGRGQLPGKLQLLVFLFPVHTNPLSQQWFATNFDKMSVEQKKWAREMWPEFYEQRLALLDKEMDLYKRVARLGVTGIQSKEDLLLTYAKESGYIDMARLVSLAHPSEYKAFTDKAEREARFVRGLWNPKRLPRKVDHANTRAANAMFANERAAAPWAAGLGIGDVGFNAQGVLDDASERKTHFADLLRSAAPGAIP